MNDRASPTSLEDIRQEVAGLTDLFRRRLMEDKSKTALYETLLEQVKVSRDLLRYRDLELLFREVLLVVDRLQSDPKNPELVEATVDELLEVFARRTLLRVNDSGEFDPRVHEALETIPANEHTPAGTIVRVHRAGYTLHGRLLRPTQVTVAIPDTSATCTKRESVDADPA